MLSTTFKGRQRELQALTKLLKKQSASLVVIQGRRRIGKSRLVEEFARNKTFFQFSGLPPTEKTTLQSQLDEFARQLTIQTGLPEVKADDWSKLFLLLAEKIQTGRMIVLFDEITWMGSKDPDFLGKLKNAWDIYFKKNAKLILVLCSSISVFLGRISYRLTLEELPLTDCNQFWEKAGGHISSYEKLKILSVTGGIPRYLEEIKPTLSAEENIKDLCFMKGGILVNEFKDVFSDLYSKRSPTYKKIIQTLNGGSLEIKEICQKLHIRQTGFISQYLDDLVKSGFVTRHYTWDLKSGETSRLSHFRLSDNYIRFYLKYIDKNRLKIESNDFDFKSLSLLPNWDSVMALQFENLVLKNRQFIKESLGIKPDEVIADNPFFQRKSARFPGCQIDYLIQTKFSTLYLCEIKFKQNEIGLEILQEMKKKLKNFRYPRRFSCRPILIHVNGVHEDVIHSGFFSEVIDFSKILES